uniref:Uncharacterized protein n=1 Tax=Glossina palpalis gambiensis TaxID=67801 RepID=A0A1B0BZ44_9MUSC
MHKVCKCHKIINAFAFIKSDRHICCQLKGSLWSLHFSSKEEKNSYLSKRRLSKWILAHRPVDKKSVELDIFGAPAQCLTIENDNRNGIRLYFRNCGGENALCSRHWERKDSSTIPIIQNRLHSDDDDDDEKRKEITHARTRILSLIKLRITPSSYYKHLRKLKIFSHSTFILV